VHLIAIDQSFSMRQGDGGATRLATAKQEALNTLASLRQGEQAQVLALDNQVRLLTQLTQEQAELRAAVQSIAATDSRSSYGELTRAVRSIAQSSRVPVVLHLFSDMQKSSMPPAFADLRLPPDVQLVLHPVAKAPVANFTVERVSAPRRISDPKKARIQATIAGFGSQAGKRNVSLLVNGKVVGSKVAELPASGRATVEFAGMDAPYGLNRAEVRIDSADQLEADNHFFFGVERSDPKKILFVHEARQPRSVLYFRNALEASADAAFSLEPVTAEQVGNVSPSNYAAVVFSDVASIPASFLEAVSAYVKKGGAALMAVGPVAGTRPRVPLFDEAVQDAHYTPRSGERFQVATEVDATHPAIGRANRWEGVKFYHTVRIDPGKSHVLAKLADGTPLLMEKKIGEGRVLVFASTFDNISNDFPLRASFVPFIEQTAYYLSGEEDRPSTLPVDSHVELRIGKDQGTAVEVLGPDGQRVLTLQEAATAQSLAVARAGFYELRRQNGRHELLAVNPDRRESDLETVSAETITLWQKAGQVSGAEQGEAAESESRKPWGLWWYILLVAIALGVAESVVASRHMSSGGEPEGQGSSAAVREPNSVLTGTR
jgi:hypothetical protein